MSRITFNQISGYCDLAKSWHIKLTITVYLVPVRWGERKEEPACLWGHQSMLTSNEITKVLVLRVLTPWPLRCILSSASVNTGKTASLTASEEEFLPNSPQYQVLRLVRRSPSDWVCLLGSCVGMKPANLKDSVPPSPPLSLHFPTTPVPSSPALPALPRQDSRSGFGSFFHIFVWILLIATSVQAFWTSKLHINRDFLSLLVLLLFFSIFVFPKLPLLWLSASGLKRVKVKETINYAFNLFHKSDTLKLIL